MNDFAKYHDAIVEAVHQLEQSNFEAQVGYMHPETRNEMIKAASQEQQWVVASNPTVAGVEIIGKQPMPKGWVVVMDMREGGMFSDAVEFREINNDYEVNA